MKTDPETGLLVMNEQEFDSLTPTLQRVLQESELVTITEYREEAQC